MDKIIYISTMLQCNPHQTFELFTMNKWLEMWLTEVADVEPVVGGKYELFWNPDDRENDSTIGCSITAIEQDKFLSFEWKGPKQFKHFANNADPLTHVVVFFLPVDGQTQVHLIHSGWRGSPEWEEARQWFVNAWQMTFMNLETLVNDQVRGDVNH